MGQMCETQHSVCSLALPNVDAIWDIARLNGSGPPWSLEHLLHIGLSSMPILPVWGKMNCQEYVQLHTPLCHIKRALGYCLEGFLSLILHKQNKVLLPPAPKGNYFKNSVAWQREIKPLVEVVVAVVLNTGIED